MHISSKYVVKIMLLGLIKQFYGDILVVKCW